ncbi:9659_t:CDS:2 [Gigaspora margarita]|uniref:9659_t:CDS:1 n=1 Tax=Gigaspora margarita TaxID=4874 RepID=A0ABN7VAF7_GIGMA|nr:9659_t:CDS:2 [Gigaspora margarita]
MEFLLEVKDLFKQDFQASSQIDAAHDQFVLKKDKIIAQWLGINNPKIITTIRVSLQRYDYFNYKQSILLSKEITKESIINLQQSSSVTPIKETKDIQETSNQPTKTNKRKKQDSGSPVNSATVNDIKKKTKTNTPDIFGSIWAPANSREFLIRKSQNDLDYHFTLWDIPLNVYYNKIKRCLNFYDKAEIIKTQNIEKENKLAEIGTMMHNILSRLDNLKLGTKKDKHKQIVPPKGAPVVPQQTRKALLDQYDHVQYPTQTLILKAELSLSQQLLIATQEEIKNNQRLVLNIADYNINDLKQNLLKLRDLSEWLKKHSINVCRIIETNILSKEGYHITKENSNFMFFWSNTNKDKKKGSGVGLLIDKQ